MRLFIAVAAATMLFASVAKAETIRILMETVPDTRYIQELLPEFEEAMGIDVEIEAISYIDMHSKLVPQLISPQGSYEPDRGRLLLGRRVHQGGLVDAARRSRRPRRGQCRRVRAQAHGSGRARRRRALHAAVLQLFDGPDLSPGPDRRSCRSRRPSRRSTVSILRVPETWDEYWKQVEFFTRDNDGDGERDFYGTVIQGQRGDCISMQWANYLYAQGGRYHDENWNPLLDHPGGHPGHGVLS